MLQAIREKTSGWVATLILGMIIVLMTLFGVQDMMQRKPDNFVARVEGPRKLFGLMAGQVRDIDAKTFQDRFNRLRGNEQASKGKEFDAVAFQSPENKRKVLEGMIDEQLLSLAAERAGIVASDAAVMRTIAAQQAFQANGKFDPNTYAEVLQRNGLTSASYEKITRDDLVNLFVQRELAETELSSESELEALVKLDRQTRDVRFLGLAPPPPVAIPTEAQVLAWYNAHKANYRSQESVAVEYVEIDASNMSVDSVADEATLRQKYQDEKLKFGSTDQRFASHILVALPEKATPAQEAAALAKARGLAAQARASGADFAAIARASSDDVGTKEAGGDLGPVEKGVFGDAFDAAFDALKPGQVSQPVKLPDGYHVLWFRELTKGDAKPFEEVRDQLEAEYQQSERERVFNDVSGKLMDKVYEDQTSLAPAAQEMKLTVQRTGQFTRDKGDGIAALEEVRKAAFADAQKTQRLVSDLVELEPNHVVVLHVIDVKPSAQLPLAAVHDRVLGDLVADLTAKAAQKNADDILARANRGESMDALAAEMGRQVTNVPSMPRSAPNPQLTPLVDAAFRLGRPVAGKNEYALAKLTPEQFALVNVISVKDGDMATLDAATRENGRKSLAARRGAVQARAYLEGLRKEYTIKINEDKL